MTTKGDCIRILLKWGVSYSEIVEEVGCSKATISYHAKILGLNKGPSPRYDWKKVQIYYDRGHSIRECCEHFGFYVRSLERAQARGDFISRGYPPQMPLEELKSRASVRRRIIKEELLPYKCSICGISKWYGKSLSLNLDHINGIANDHRLENLRWICPNCDSQSSTFAGRNVKR